jgi:hypothetical protein
LTVVSTGGEKSRRRKGTHHFPPEIQTLDELSPRRRIVRLPSHSEQLLLRLEKSLSELLAVEREGRESGFVVSAHRVRPVKGKKTKKKKRTPDSRPTKRQPQDEVGVLVLLPLRRVVNPLLSAVRMQREVLLRPLLDNVPDLREGTVPRLSSFNVGEYCACEKGVYQLLTRSSPAEEDAILLISTSSKRQRGKENARRNRSIAHTSNSSIVNSSHGGRS